MLPHFLSFRARKATKTVFGRTSGESMVEDDDVARQDVVGANHGDGRLVTELIAQECDSMLLPNRSVFFECLIYHM